MKKVLSAVAVLAIVGSALAFTAKKTLFQVLECMPISMTCQELDVNAIGVGVTIKGNPTFNANLIGQPCSGNCDQMFKVEMEVGN